MTRLRATGVADLVPIIGTLRGYPRAWLRADSVASLTLWALLVPQALAYASLAGLPPAAGLYVGLFGMLAYAVLGTSRLLTVGPESTIAIIVAGTVAPLAGADPKRYATSAALLAVLVGGFLFIGAMIRAGFITKVFSAPVLIGYLTGAGTVIALSQLSKLLGYSVHGSYPTVIGGLIEQLHQTKVLALCVGLGTVAIMLAVRHWLPWLPAALIALAVATLTSFLAGLDSRIPVVGTFDTALSFATFGDLRLSDVNALIVPALSIAVFTFATSVLTARAIDPKHADLLEPNREFLALGSANLAAGLCGGFPANSSESRSFALSQGGARSQVANLLGAGLLIVTILLLTPLFTKVPQAALGAVILVTAIGLIDVAGLKRLYRLRTADFVLAGITLVGVLVTGPMGGIVVGVVASLLDVIRRTVMPHTAVLGRLPGAGGGWHNLADHADAAQVPGVLVYRFEAPLFFGNAERFRNEIRQLVDASLPPVLDVIVDAAGINDLDVSGAETLRTLITDLLEREVHLSFVRLRRNVRDLMVRLGLDDYARSYSQVEDALRAAARRGGEPVIGGNPAEPR
ncbi:MAG: SulP family inorganic anion transporter [Jatrophihabitantaceae bacterium]